MLKVPKYSIQKIVSKSCRASSVKNCRIFSTTHLSQPTQVIQNYLVMNKDFFYTLNDVFFFQDEEHIHRENAKSYQSIPGPGVLTLFARFLPGGKNAFERI